MAFDFGEARIGVAQGECSIGIAHPLATVTGGSNDEKFAKIAALVGEWQPEILVVGLPLHTDGTEHELTRLARKFGRRLSGRFRLPVYWADERLSSVYAEELLRETACADAGRSPYWTKRRRRRFCRVFLTAARPNILTGEAERIKPEKARPTGFRPYHNG